MSPESPVCGERQDRPEPVLVQNSGHVDISALNIFFEIDGRKSRYIKEVLDWYRDEMPEISGDMNRNRKSIVMNSKNREEQRDGCQN